MLLTSLFQQTTQSNASQVAVQLLNLLKVSVTRTTVIDTIKSHPDYPSLFSISDSLSKWKVENMALEVEYEKLPQIPAPFIAWLQTRNFIIVIKNESETVTCLSETGTKINFAKEAFLAQWSRVVLVAEATQHSGEKGYVAHRRKEQFRNARIPIITVLCCVFITIATILKWTTSNGMFPAFLSILKLAGCIVTGLLLWHEIDKANPALKQICSGGKHVNCDAVLNSKGAKLFNVISWSEIGFLYFSGGFLFLLWPVYNQQDSLMLLSWLNSFTVPYIMFSVTYQWLVAKQWCLLCLAVQGLLVAEAIVGYFGYWSLESAQAFSYTAFLTSLIIFSLPLLFWLFVKPALLRAQQAEQYNKELARLKYNPEIFDALLTKQRLITFSTEGLGITLGDPNAKNTIIKVCNPYCGPCARAHPVLEELLENNVDTKLQIIFTASDDENDNRSKPVKHLMALYQKDHNAINKALDDWYGADYKDYSAFADKYKLNGELQKQGEKLKAMNGWCRKMKIDYTPTFFVNGYQMPEIYKVEDLKHILT